MLIKDSLEETEGITSVDISHKSGKMKVNFDEKIIDENKIRDIVKKEGYRVV